MKSALKQAEIFVGLLHDLRRAIGEDFHDSSRDSGESKTSLAKKQVVEFFQKSDASLDLKFLYEALHAMSQYVSSDERLRAVLHAHGFELDNELRKISESKNKVEERKLFGVCFLDHERKMRHAIFDELGLKLWLQNRKIEINEEYIVDAKIGETYSFIGRYDFIFWRMVPSQQE